MKISELINDLAQIYGKDGDIDVVCVVPEDRNFGTAAPNKENCTVTTTTDIDRDHNGITTDKFLYIGMY
jgi:hypothetical protein